MLDFLEYCDAVDTHIKNPPAASFQKCPFHGCSVCVSACSVLLFVCACVSYFLILTSQILIFHISQGLIGVYY